jgi:hypothetical protein
MIGTAVAGETSIYQQGAGTRRIDRTYSIHYSLFTMHRIALLDAVVGLAGLFMLLLMTATG